MKYKISISTLTSTALAAGVWLAATSVAAQETEDLPIKIGYVDATEVVSSAPQSLVALEELRAKYSAREQQLNAKQEELNSIELKLAEADDANLSLSEVTQLRADARQLTRELERESADLSEDYNFDRNQRLDELQRLISDVILQMAHEENFDLIVQSPVVWASQRIDITSAVLEKLNQLSEQ